MAAHDLHFPLTGSCTFAELLSARYADGLGDLGDCGCSFVIRIPAVMEWQLLIDNLLAYARAWLAADIASTCTVVQREGLPTVWGDANAVSGSGAKGLMQLMDGTAAAYGVTNSFDPQQNLMGGSRFLRSMLDQFGGNAQLALAAYNAGPAAVTRYGGVPPYGETQSYVQKVLAMAQQNSIG